MTSPFRTDEPTGNEDLGAVMEAAADVRSQAGQEALFLGTVTDQVDSAIYALVGDTGQSPFQTDAVLPDQARTGSALDRIDASLNKAQDALLSVLGNPDRYPVSTR